MSLKPVRSVVVLVLALAVPLQGAAAVTAGLCMAMGHGHGSAASALGHDVDDHHANPSGAHKHSDPDQSKPHCAPCVACCAAVAIPSAVSLFVPERPAASAIASASASFTGVSPDHLDRPPLAL